MRKKRIKNNELRKHKSGQVTLFIIIAIAIVAFALLVFMFYPKISSTIGIQAKSPSQFIQSCLEDDVKLAVEILSPQGGSIEPEFYYTYDNTKIEYLCYTEEYYKTCVMQQPMLKSHIENEIKAEISNKAGECMNELAQSYKKRGYDVSLKKGKMSVELLPKRIVVLFNSSMALVKGPDRETSEKISMSVNNNLYELVSITNSILNWEARYGDAEVTTYMNYYHDLKVEKKKQSDGTTIYILTDRNNGNKFQFASRSIPWPPGFGSSQIRVPQA